MTQRATIQLHSIAPDLIPQDAPQSSWNNAQNVVFRNGESYRVFGDMLTMTTSDTPRTAVYVESGGTQYWVWASEAGCFAWDGTLHHDVTPSNWAPAADAVFTSTTINGLAVVNASDSEPVWWDGIVSNVMTTLPDWDPLWRAQAMRSHKNFLFAIGVEQEQRVRWSDAAEAGVIPQHWVPDADNLAGFQDLAPLSAPTLDGITLRDSFLVFKRGSIWSFDYIGGQFVFNIRKSFAERGVIATNALTRGPDDQVLFAADDGDVYLTNGVQMQSVLDGRAQRAYYQQLNPTGVFSAASLQREKLGILSFATSSGGVAALMYDFISADIGFRDMSGALMASEGRVLDAAVESADWDSDAQAWDNDSIPWNVVAYEATIEDVIIGGPFGFATISDSAAHDFASGPVVAFAQKQGLSFGDAKARKQVSRLWPKVTGPEGTPVTFRIGGQEATGGPVSWGPEQVYTIGESDHLDSFTQGRFMALEVKSDGGPAWRLGTVDVEYREVGRW